MFCRILVARQTQNPGAIRDRLGRIARTSLASFCSDSMSSMNLEDEVVRIRRLELDLWVDIRAMSEADIARRWGGALAASIKDTMARGGQDNVRRFSSPQNFVTRFLRDLLDGAAWDRWYYDEFRPLKSLQTREIAVQFLLARPGWIVPVLAELQATGHAERLIERMTTQDLRRLWTALKLAPDAAPDYSQAERQSVRRLAVIWPKVAMAHRSDSESRAKDRFRLLLAAAGGTEGVRPDEPLAKAVKAMVDVAAVVRIHPSFGPVLLMGSGLYPAAEQELSSGPLADVVPWMAKATTTAEGRSFAAAVAEAVGVALPIPFGAGGQIRQTSPDPESAGLVDSGGQAAKISPDPESAGPAAASGRAPEFESPPTRSNDRPATIDKVIDDPVVERRSGQMQEIWSAGANAVRTSAIGSVFLICPALAELGLWELWNDEVGEVAARRNLFAVALKALGRTNALKFQNDPALAIFAGLGDTPNLLSDAVFQGEKGAEWPAAIPEIASRCRPVHERDLVWDSVRGVEVLRDAAARHWLGARPVDSSRTPSAAMWTSLHGDRNSVRTSLSDQEKQELSFEAAHFQLGDDLSYPWLTPPLDANLSVVASLVLRRTAERLPGFGISSPAYLARQFLAQPASLALDSSGLTVRLGGGPLGVVLRLALLPDASEIPWLQYPLSLTAPHGYGSLA